MLQSPTSTRRETALFRAGAGLIGLRVLDDTVIQPAAGTSVLDHPVSALVPLMLLALVAWGYPRIRRGAWRGLLALILGVLGIATGADAVYYTRELGLGADDVTGFVAIAAGLGLIGLGAATMWLRRGPRRVFRRAAFGLGALLGFALAVFPTTIGYVSSHTARAVVPPDRLGVPHETVTFESTDGLALEGWYIPSRNGAAVIVTPGRNGPQEQARMLARHGYGVLLFDRRGEGHSEGRPNAFGWGGDRDIKGAIAFLKRRGIERIGGIGLSVGGELMLETAAESKELDAVVSEGAGARVMGEELDQPGLPATDRPLTALTYVFRDLAMTISANELPPKHLKTLVPQIEQPTLLIAAPNTQNGEKLNRVYAKGTKATLWEIPESKHVQGIKARPAEYEQRVVGFFDRTL
jgi:fermentation-respiration switch protein FrsA (DUF1100 family)